jgi:transcriptional regulator with XRE-family HTH domain
MRDRIVKFITTENISSTKFADEIGVQRSSVSHILSGRNNPGFEFIQKILTRYKHLNAEWLIMGTGNMFKTVRQTSIFDELDNKSTNNEVKPAAPIENLITNQPAGGNEVLNIPTEIKKEAEAFIIKNEARNEAKAIEKVLIIYSDKTFSEYKPEN